MGVRGVKSLIFLCKLSVGGGGGWQRAWKGLSGWPLNYCFQVVSALSSGTFWGPGKGHGGEEGASDRIRKQQRSRSLAQKGGKVVWCGGLSEWGLGWEGFLSFFLKRANQFPTALTATGRPKHNGGFSTRGLDVLFLRPSVACHLPGPSGRSVTKCSWCFVQRVLSIPYMRPPALSPFWGWLIRKQRGWERPEETEEGLNLFLAGGSRVIAQYWLHTRKSSHVRHLCTRFLTFRQASFFFFFKGESFRGQHSKATKTSSTSLWLHRQFAPHKSILPVASV